MSPPSRHSGRRPLWAMPSSPGSRRAGPLRFGCPSFSAAWKPYATRSLSVNGRCQNQCHHICVATVHRRGGTGPACRHRLSDSGEAPPG